VTQRAMAAIIDDGGLYPPDLARAGTRLERVLIVRGQTPLETARAADLLLRSRACRLVLMTAPDLRSAIWIRLAALAHRNGILLLAVVPRAEAPLVAAAGLRLHCTRERSMVRGKRGPWCTFAGYDVRAEVRKYAAFPSGAQARIRAVEPLEGVPLRERPHENRERVAHAALR